MMRIIQYIFVFLIISLMGSMSVQASDAIDTAQIAISLEKINLKVKNLEISVQSIILEYEALGDEKKVSDWEKVADKLEDTLDHVNDALDFISDDGTVDRSEINEMIDNIEDDINDVVVLSISAATGKKTTKTFKSIKSDPNVIESSSGSSGKVELDFYVMSQCPYGTQVEDAIAPVLEKLGDSVDFNLNFIATDQGNGKFNALHGQPEVEGNIVQLCAIKHNPDKYMDMILCQNRNAQAIPGNWEKCAEDNGLDVESIKECYEGEQGKELLSESIIKTKEVGATGSPTIYLNGEQYSGNRDSASFQRAICAQLDNHPECDNIAKCSTDSDCPGKEGKIPRCENPGTKDAKCTLVNPVEVKHIVLNDKRCETCDTSGVLSVTERLFPGIDVEEIDVNSGKGKQLVEELDLTFAPVYLFEESIELTETWKTDEKIKSSFEKVGEYWKILDGATGASHFIDDEKRLAEIAKTADALDLDLDDNKPQIDFFIMSYCPYGNQAEELIEPVYQNLQDKAIFNPRYIIYKSGSGCYEDEDGKYCSMHGSGELHQDIRELCVNKYMGTEDFFRFILAMNRECTSNNADTCWEDVADDLDLDVEVIKTCEEDEAVEIAKKEQDLNNLLKVGGSPTIYIEGELYSGARTSTGYHEALCNAFDNEPEECENTYDEDASDAPSGGCG